MNINELLNITPFLLYAETHYSFKGVYSRLKKKEPEVIIDLPHRIEPGHPIPVMLLMKDSHLFPAKIQYIDVTILKLNQVVFQQKFQLDTDYIRQKYFTEIVEIESPTNLYGQVQIDVEFQISTAQKTNTYKNDNYRISTHQPFQVYIAKDPLPCRPNWYFGDMHCHSSYTEDQAEFGAPLEASVKLSKAIGLSFFAVNDHSYDLDDDESSYLKNDPDLQKWNRLKKEVAQLNEKWKDFVILPGEETSAGNSKNRNVHFLIVNNSEFIPGKGDSAEKWFRTKPDLSISKILEMIDSHALAIAAHPEINPPFLEWLLIRRGKWLWQDYQFDRLDGMQIWNGINDYSFAKGIERWKQLLLHGKKLYIYAGNDAHGNFNRFRQIGFPFFTMKESYEQLFGKMRTAVFMNTCFNLKNLTKALKHGQCIITDGPFIEFSIKNETGHIAEIGNTIYGKSFQFEINALSTPEFGKLCQLNLYMGDLVHKTETSIRTINNFEKIYQFSLKDSIALSPPTCYFRLELTTSKNHQCLTNPVWVMLN